MKGTKMANSYRTHTCGELTKDNLGATVSVSGWIHNKRDHGGVLFIDLRDHYGLTQVVISPENKDQYAIGHLPKETVVKFTGEVIARTDENVNPNMATGTIEVVVESYEVLGTCESLPFPVFPETEVPEEQRLTYRFIDLRKEKMHNNIVLRSKVISHLRQK